jgi:NNP family nitrate/nitrite transporter-like MFS transporter
MKDRSASRIYGGLLLLTGLFFLNFTARVIFSPLLPILEREFDLDHAASGSLFLLISVGYFISILSSGCISSRINHKKTIVLSTVATGTVLLILSLCSSLWSMRLGLFCLGLAAGLYLPSGLYSIGRLVPPSYLARGMAVHELAPNFGFIAAPVLADILLRYCTWQQGLMWFGLFMISAGVLYAAMADKSNELTDAPNFSDVYAVLSQTKFWLMTLFFSLAICSSLGIYAMLPLYLVSDQGLSTEQASRVLAYSRIAALMMPLAAGWLGDRIGNKAIMGCALMLAGIFTVSLGLSRALPWVMTFVVLQPMVAVCFFPSGFAVLSAMGPEGKKGLAVSLCIPVAFLGGGGLLPALIGSIGDFASIGVGFLVTGTAIMSGAALSFFVSFEKNAILSNNEAVTNKG